MFAPKYGSLEETNQTCVPNQSDQFGKNPQNVNWNSPFDTLVEYIKMHK
jgi:hypothetical protein